MNILDSKDINNRVKVRSVITSIVVHIILASVTFGISLLLLLVFATIASTIYKKEINLATSSANEFKKVYPLRYFGVSYGNFEHIFYHDSNIERNVFEAITGDLKKKANLTNIDSVNIVDIDPDLSMPDKRQFVRIDSGSTNRGTTITLIFKTANFESMQSVQWWVLAGGYIDKDKKFNKIAYSLFTLPFWIIPYIKNEYDILPGVRTIYPSYYNTMDIATKIKSLHEIVFQAMVEELDRHGIDTSELKAQKMQVMNIDISGGKVNMGNIVQGGMNKIASTIKGDK